MRRMVSPSSRKKQVSRPLPQCSDLFTRIGLADGIAFHVILGRKATSGLSHSAKDTTNSCFLSSYRYFSATSRGCKLRQDEAFNLAQRRHSRVSKVDTSCIVQQNSLDEADTQEKPEAFAVRIPGQNSRPEPVYIGMESSEETEDEQTIRVKDLEVGKRLDQIISSRYNGQSRTYFQELIEEGFVRVNEKVVKVKSRKLERGDTIRVRFIIQTRSLPLQPEDIPLDILYEDEHLVILNKAAGMVTHPAPGHWTGTMVHALAYRYENLLHQNGPRPGVIHRLDKGTSGVIVAARTAHAHSAMTDLFAKREVEKTYIAIAVGDPAGSGCTTRVLDAPIGRSRVDRQKMMVLSEEAGGRAARSIVETLGSDSRGLLHVVRIKLETGRTHQIRVHLRHARAPVLGDDLYGAVDVNRRFKSSANRPMLHAQRIQFTNPMTGRNVDVSAPLPSDIRGLIERNIFSNLSNLYPEW